ncbi:glycosyl hydrolase family 28-related protein [Streptomyces californicus]
MARHPFGGASSDAAVDTAGVRIPGATGTVWDGPSDGATQVTDLLDEGHAPISVLTADAHGMLPVFWGPDSAEKLWVSFGLTRVAVVATNVGERLAAHVKSVDPHGSHAAASAELSALRGSPRGLATLDDQGKVPSTQLPSLTPELLDWLVVTAAPYSAQGDGVTDDTAAIQAAINTAGVGGVVYFPRGVYRTSAPLDLPRGVTLTGSHSNLAAGAGKDDYPCYIQALPGFTSGAMITIIGDADGSRPAGNGEQRLNTLMLDGSQVKSGTLDGIYARGNVRNVVIRDVCIRGMPARGIATDKNAQDELPSSWRLHSVTVDGSRSTGYAFDRTKNLTMIDCQAIGCGATGFKVTSCANSTFIGCRAELTMSHGFHLTGSWASGTDAGSSTLSACSTDRCGQDGVRIDATGGGPAILNGLRTRGDGRTGGGSAGLALLSRVPVVVTGLICHVGLDDTGTASPDYGLRVAGARDVTVVGAYLHGAVAGVVQDASERVSLTAITDAGDNPAGVL